MISGLHFWNYEGLFESTYLANIADDNRSDGCKRFVMRTDEKLTAFLKLESVIRNTQYPLPTFFAMRYKVSGRKRETVYVSGFTLEPRPPNQKQESKL